MPSWVTGVHGVTVPPFARKALVFPGKHVRARTSAEIRRYRPLVTVTSGHLSTVDRWPTAEIRSHRPTSNQLRRPSWGFASFMGVCTLRCGWRSAAVWLHCGCPCVFHHVAVEKTLLARPSASSYIGPVVSPPNGRLLCLCASSWPANLATVTRRSATCVSSAARRAA